MTNFSTGKRVKLFPTYTTPTTRATPVHPTSLFLLYEQQSRLRPDREKKKESRAEQGPPEAE